jgi:iron-sulfur cluster repair protein YtfE (RIC family)
MAEPAVVDHPPELRLQPMNDVLHLLTADHLAIEACVDELRSSVPGHERARLIAELDAQLTIHLHVEEVALHPMVRDIVGRSQEEESDVEHELIRGSLTQVTQLGDAPGFRAAVEMLSAGITRHVADEEQTILPELLREMSPEEQSALGDAIVDARRSGDRLPRRLPTSSSELPAANAFNAGR